MVRKLDEAKAQEEIEKVSKFADKNQRLSWRRKQKRIEELVERIRPIEDEILELILKKQPIMDEIEEVRKKMLKECVHTADNLVHKGDHILCKFCNRRFNCND